MASTTPFLEAIASRRSLYNISAENPPVPDSRVEEIVKAAIHDVPSSYNSQSSRAVILFGDSNQKLWDIVIRHIQGSVPEQVWSGMLAPRIQKHRSGRGTVMFFEDEAAIDALKQKNPMVIPLATEWSDTTSGMHQFVVWTGLEAEGFGASLQHFNFHPLVTKEVLETFKLPDTWKLKAQVVFGTRLEEELREKTFESMEERVRVFSEAQESPKDSLVETI